MSNPKLLPGYDAPGPKGKKTQVWVQKGPTATYVAGTGQVLQAAQFGAKGFDHVSAGGLSESTTYFCGVKYGATIVAGAAVAQHLTAVTYITLLWYVASTGLEYAGGDLSGESIRLAAITV